MKKPAKKPAGKTKAKVKASPKPVDLELDPDAWPKFEALVRSAAKMGHRPQKSGTKTKG
jgi:hypothetical protein